jgi:hypothetical protein
MMLKCFRSRHEEIKQEMLDAFVNAFTKAHTLEHGKCMSFHGQIFK